MANIAGGWKLANMQACALPRKVATGFVDVTKNIPARTRGTFESREKHGTRYGAGFCLPHIAFQ